MATQTEIIEIKFKGEEAKKGLTDLNDEVEKLKQSFTSADVKAAGGLSNFKKELTGTKKEAKQTTEAVKKTTKANKNFAVESVKTNKIIATTDRLTGGMATAFIDLYQGLLQSGKAAKVFIGGLSGIKKALIATGVGAFTILIGALLANLDLVKDAFSGATEVSKAYKEAQDDIVSAVSKVQKSITKMENVFEQAKKGTISKDEALKEYNKSLGESVGYATSLSQAEGLLVSNASIVIETTKLKAQAEVLYAKAAEARAKVIAGDESLDPTFWQEVELGITSVGDLTSLAIATNVKYAKNVNESLNTAKKLESSAADIQTKILKLQEGLKKGSINPKDIKETNDEIKKLQELQELADNEKLQEEADKRLENLKDRIREAEANKQDEARALELQKIKEHNEALMVEALANGLLSQELVNSLNETFQAKKDEFALQDAEKEAAIKAAKDKVQLENDLKEAARKQAIADKDKELEEEKIKNKKAVVNAIAQFADAESGIGKALLIVKQGLALKETIMDLKRITFKGIEAVGSAGVATAQNVAESSKIGFPQNIITIAGAIAQGVGIIKSVKNAVSKTKAAASASASASVPSITSPSPPAAVSQAPSFNIVGASETSQLANVINTQENLPVQAYVVSQDITTAQSLQNNIIQSATID